MRQSRLFACADPTPATGFVGGVLSIFEGIIEFSNYCVRSWHVLRPQAR